MDLRGEAGDRVIFAKYKCAPQARRSKSKG